MIKQTVKLFLILLSVIFLQCTTNPITSTLKFQSNDPFRNTIVPSQLFEIDGKQDNVVQGENGTLLVLPKGCFKNASGEIVEDKVVIELSEAFSLQDMILSNLTTTSDGKLLETDGMIYFNATANGEQLAINKDNPIHIDIPTPEKKQGMMAYKGIRDVNGNMNWIEPKALDNYLTIVDLDSLDFLPSGFQAEVDKGMPYRRYATSTKTLTDSLYYSLSISLITEVMKENVPAEFIEPYYDDNQRVDNGKYLPRSDQAADSSARPRKINCGLDPAIIKVIKSEKYQHTFIATREFEERLKAVFKTCDNAVLEIYIKNLDKNLYEADSLAAAYCNANKYYESEHEFYNFSQQRLTKVRDADKYAILLKGYYEKQMASVKAELKKGEEHFMKALKEKNEKSQKIVNDYKKLLVKREKHRMKTYGFTWTNTGWVNIDTGTIPKDWSYEPLEIIVENGKEFDEVYTYVVYTSIKSLYRLNSTDKQQFYVGNATDRKMLMPKYEMIIAIVIGYKDGLPAVAVYQFGSATVPTLTVTLSPTTAAEIKETIQRYERYSKENKISEDLALMKKLYEEKQRQKKWKKEIEFFQRLWKIAHPCCAEYVE